MIFNLRHFLSAERGYWSELEAALDRLQIHPESRFELDAILRLHYLYQRAASDLARLGALPSDPETRAYLESLVARAYAELNESRSGWGKFSFWRWLFGTFPRAFRRYGREWALAVAITIGGAGFGAVMVRVDSEAKSVIMPFPGLLGSPGERVKQEESSKTDRVGPYRASFSAQLMTHNIRVALVTLAMGMTWGVGSIALLFFNGVALGAVCADYVAAGYTRFLMGWLMPHGVIEIPAILIAGQAGFVIAGALIGWGDGTPRRARLRRIGGDVVTLASGAAVLLVWAGIIEAFFSQYHEPVLPYAVKIALGVAELFLLIILLWVAGRE